MRRTAWMCATALLAGCGGSDGPGTAGDAVSGTSWSVLENTGSGAWTDATRWHATLGLELGGVDGEGPKTFGNIGAVTADEDGRIYVLEYLAQEIRVFDAEGSHLRTFARQGEGPGELGSAAGLTWDAEGNLWAWDTRNNRFAGFTREGEFLRVVPRRAMGVLYPWPGRFDMREGMILDWGLDRPEDRGNDIGALNVYNLVGVQGERGELHEYPILEKRYELTAPGQRQIFGGLLTTALDGNGGVFFAHTERYEVLKRDLQGDTLFGFSRPDAPLQTVSDQEVDSMQAIYREAYQGRREVPGDGAFAETKPVIKRMLVDGAGHLLVFVDEEGPEITTHLDVFEAADGRYLGRVVLPVFVETNPRPFATPGALYGMVKGELDVPVVVRVDLAPAGE